MMEKRFRKVQGYIEDNQGVLNDNLLDLTEIEDMLNNLYNKNRELKRIIKAITEDYKDLRKCFDEQVKGNDGIEYDTVKRFTYGFDGIKDNGLGKQSRDLIEICNWLNELYENK